MGNIMYIIKKLFNKQTLYEKLTVNNYSDDYFKNLSDTHVIYILFVGFLHGNQLLNKNNGNYVLKFGKSENFSQRIKAHRKTFPNVCNVLHIGPTISATQVENHIKKQMRLENKLLKLEDYGTELLLFNTESEYNLIKSFIEKSIREIKNKQHKQFEQSYHIGSPWF